MPNQPYSRVLGYNDDETQIENDKEVALGNKYDVRTLPIIPANLPSHRLDPKTGRPETQVNPQYAESGGYRSEVQRALTNRLHTLRDNNIRSRLVNDNADLYDNTRTVGQATQRGVKMDPATLATLALKEGRPDFGNNEAPVLIKQDQELMRQMGEADPSFPTERGQIVAKINYANRMADKTGKSFYEVWNGTGRSGVNGQTGAQYAAGAQRGQANTMNNPNNAKLRAFIADAFVRGQKDR